MEQSDGRDVLFQKLGYSPTKYNLHVVPNCSLWAGILQSQISSMSTKAAYKELGTLLLEHGRNYSLVLVANGKPSDTERDAGGVVPGDVDCSTPEFDSHIYNLNESGYSTYNSGSSLTTPSTDDVIMTSSSKASNESTAKGESDCIIISDTEDEMEDPLCIAKSRSSAGRLCALPGLFSHRLHFQPMDNSTSISPAGPFFTPSRTNTKEASHERSEMRDCRYKTSNVICNRLQMVPQPSNDDVVIISSSDEAEKLQSSNAYRQQAKVVRLSGNSSDEGIALESVWEEHGYGNKEELPQCRKVCLSKKSGYQSQFSSLSGGFQSRCLVNRQESPKQPAGIRCCGFELSPADLRTLEPHQWLNDQVSLIGSTVDSKESS